MIENTTTAEILCKGDDLASVSLRGEDENPTLLSSTSSSIVGERSILEGNPRDIRIVFSDVDGTLVHYPTNHNNETNVDTIFLPPSSTGMRGVISQCTLSLCARIRRCRLKKGGTYIPLVLISGMRTTTLLQRIPFLPKADAYAPEGGGRIFYPMNTSPNVNDGDDNNGRLQQAQFATAIMKPESYKQAKEVDIQPFQLVEDMNWSRYVQGKSLCDTDVGHCQTLELGNTVLSERCGSLWNFAKCLEKEGFVLDYRGYSNCFRVNLSHQKTNMKNKHIDAFSIEEKFRSLSLRDLSHFGLTTTVNLGCIDIYPERSGKKNCCAYLAQRLLGEYSGDNNNIKRCNSEANSDIDSCPTTCSLINKIVLSPSSERILSSHAAFLCDDENDMEMARACAFVLLPSVASPAVRDSISTFNTKNGVNTGNVLIFENIPLGIIGTKATEAALKKLLDSVA